MASILPTTTSSVAVGASGGDDGETFASKVLFCNACLVFHKLSQTRKTKAKRQQLQALFERWGDTRYFDILRLMLPQMDKERATYGMKEANLGKLYVELLKENPDWATAERRPDMNHFMARLIFCFFAEDTDIFNGEGLFTSTVERFSDRESSNTHEIIISYKFKPRKRMRDTKCPDWG